MAGKKKTWIVYWEGGEDYKGEFELSRTDLRYMKNCARYQRCAGFLSGYRTRFHLGRGHTESVSVIVFFKEEPSEEEILRRRKNGFKAARWHRLI